jgi:NADH:ubiquinone oxidoreductase subunit E
MTHIIDVENSLAQASLRTEVKNAEPKLIQEDLYFGRNITGDKEVSEAQFQAFIDAEITPQFPDGLTVYETNGQFLDSKGNLIQEPSQVISLIFENTLKNQGKIDQITESYKQQFKQESVLEVVNEDQLIGFDESTDLIDNDPIPELIQEDLYFGRNIKGGGEVSEAEFQAFIDAEITPRFPDGLTVYDADGQFLDITGTLIEEPSQVVSLIFEDTPENEQSIDQIIAAYKQQFQQESVLEVVNEEVNIGFDESADLIDNDPIPELIQEDLYFGRNIKGGGEVSEAEFQKFLDREITPRFADGLTVYDADGQFLDSTGTLIQEPSKVVSLIFEDTTQNEAAIEQIIAAYKQQFQQESVLQVVDEEIQVAFNSDTIFVDDREHTFCGFEDSQKLIDELLRSAKGYDILLGEVGNDTLIGAQGQNSDRDTITDFVAAEQILFPVVSFEGMPGETSAISLDQFTLGMTAFDAGDQSLIVSYD